MAKSTRIYILHNTMKPSTRQAAVEYEAWARGTRGELRDQGQGPEPGGQNQGTRTKQQIQKARQGPRASSDKNRHRAPRLENNQGIQRGRDLGMTDQVKKTDRRR